MSAKIIAKVPNFGFKRLRTLFIVAFGVTILLSAYKTKVQLILLAASRRFQINSIDYAINNNWLRKAPSNHIGFRYPDAENLKGDNSTLKAKWKAVSAKWSLLFMLDTIVNFKFLFSVGIKA